MLTKKVFRTFIILLIISANIGCDQISKSIVRETVDKREWIEVFQGNLILTNVENPGAFFGWMSDLPPVYKSVFLALLPALAILSILYVVLTRMNLKRGAVVGLSFIVGGGIGNIFDRIAYGSVTDFLHIDLGVFRTGIFNMADVSIMVGMGLVLWDMAINNKGEQIEVVDDVP